MIDGSRNTVPVLSVSDFYGNDPFGDRGYFAHRPDSWNDVAVPDWIRTEQRDLQDDIDKADKANRVNQVLSQIAGSAPIFGSLFKLLFDIPIAVTNAHIQKQRNKQERINSYFENWYNSPRQQMRRLNLAGINPYTHGQAAVRAYPASVPQYQTYQAPYLSSPSVGTMPQMLNAMTNMQLAQARMENLDSLTAINEYKFEELLPQLYDKNGYLNTILSLQAAWETNNYDYERQLKQNLLDISYKTSITALGEKILELQPNTDNVRTVVDPDAGTVFYENVETGEIVDFSKMSFSELPVFLQKAFTDIYSKQSNISLNQARNELMSAQASTQSALAALYNANREKVQINVDAYHRTGVWATDDFTLRFAAGMIQDQTYWKQFGLNSLNQLQEGAIDLGTSYLNPKYLLQGKQPTVMPSVPASPQKLKIPQGAKPFTYQGQIYYY